MGKPAWVVKNVVAREDYTLLVDFQDGSRKIFDMKPFLDEPIYAKLKNPALFMQVRAVGDTAVWDDDTDIAPEFLWEAGKPVQGAACANASGAAIRGTENVRIMGLWAIL